MFTIRNSLLPLLFGVLFSTTSFTQTIQPERITIVRDTFGTPHIYAPNDAEVAYGLAWATCEDQLEVVLRNLSRATGKGAELYGKAGAIEDYFRKFVQAEAVSQTAWAQTPADFRAVLQGYADGLNAYAEHNAMPARRFKRLFPIEPQDLMASYVVLSAGMIYLPKYLLHYRGAEAEDTPGLGSNHFAFKNGITDYNRTTLIINPHWYYTGTESFYEYSLHSDEGWDFWGVGFPGLIAPAMGTNRSAGWAVTYNYADFVDVYALKINPKNENQYWLDGRWWDLREEKLKMKVKLGPMRLPVEQQLWWSAHGPVVRAENGTFALRYAQKDPARAGEQFYRMSKAQSLAQFHKALDMQAITMFNFAYADKADNIYYIFNANLPKRLPNYDYTKPLPGDSSHLIWKKYYTREELPQVENPECGYVYNTNNTPYHTTCSAEVAPKTLPENTGIDKNPVNERDLRVRELLTLHGGQTWSREALRTLKYDNQPPTESPLMTHYNSAIEAIGDSVHHELKPYWSKIKPWDGVLNPGDSTDAFHLLTLYRLGQLGIDVEVSDSISRKQMLTAMVVAKRILDKYYNTIFVPIERIVQLCRGDVCAPVYGAPDKLRAFAFPEWDNERERSYLDYGDSYIAFVEYDASGLQSLKTIMPFGASLDPESQHYNDQLRMAAHRELRTHELNRQRLEQQAERVYSPK